MSRVRVFPMKRFLPAVLLIGGCSEGPNQDRFWESEIDSVPDTVVTMESAWIGRLVDIVIDEQEFLYILDGQAQQIHVVDPMGQSVGAIGRPGQGPGELGAATSLHLVGDTLIVVDAANRRLQLFSQRGGDLGSQPFSDCADGSAPPVVAVDGTTILPTLGFQPGLATVCDNEGGFRTIIGEHLIGGDSFVDFTEARAMILEGQIPPLIMNNAIVVAGEDGTIWLAVSAAQRVERYDAQGRPLLRLDLDEPEFEMIHSEWVAQHVEDTGVPGLFLLEFFLRAREVDGDLWILLNTGDGSDARILVVPEEGLAHRFVFPNVTGAGDFAVDPRRTWVYFYIDDTTELIRVPWQGS